MLGVAYPQPQAAANDAIPIDPALLNLQLSSTTHSSNIEPDQSKRPGVNSLPREQTSAPLDDLFDDFNPALPYLLDGPPTERLEDFDLLYPSLANGPPAEEAPARQAEADGNQPAADDLNEVSFTDLLGELDPAFMSPDDQVATKNALNQTDHYSNLPLDLPSPLSEMANWEPLHHDQLQQEASANAYTTVPGAETAQSAMWDSLFGNDFSNDSLPPVKQKYDFSDPLAYFAAPPTGADAGQDKRYEYPSPPDYTQPAYPSPSGNTAPFGDTTLSTNVREQEFEQPEQPPSTRSRKARVATRPPVRRTKKRGAPRKKFFLNAPDKDQPLPPSAATTGNLEILDHFPEHLCRTEVMRRFVRLCNTANGGGGSSNSSSGGGARGWDTSYMVERLLKHDIVYDFDAQGQRILLEAVDRASYIRRWVTKERDACTKDLRRGRQRKWVSSPLVAESWHIIRFWSGEAGPPVSTKKKDETTFDVIILYQ